MITTTAFERCPECADQPEVCRHCAPRLALYRQVLGERYERALDEHSASGSR